MRRKTDFFGLMVIVFMCFMVGGVSAQGDFTDEELEWIDFVAQAFESTLDVDSYSAEVEQYVHQEMSTTPSVEATNEVLRTIELQVENGADGINFSAVVEQDRNAESGEQSYATEITLELIQFDGEFYARASDISPRSRRDLFPDDWISVTEDGDRYPLIDALNLGSPDLLYNSSLNLLIDEDAVLEINEDDSDEISGLEIRVFQIEYSAEAMLENDAMAPLVDVMLVLPGIDVEDVMSQIADGSEMNLTVWIGEEDELVYRIDSNFNIDADMSISGVELGIVQETESSARYGDFGEDFDIEAPDL